jgi:hypothetical protein
VPLEHIREVRGERTFFIIPNALLVTTITGKILKIIVDPGDRNAWLKAIEEQLDKI